VILRVLLQAVMCSICALKECVADLTLENRLLKKSMIADGDDDA
jgi:glutamate synthase domain-containing protein 2